MTMGLLGVDLVACVTVTIASGWLVTESRMSRVARVACAFLAAGACVNTVGIYGMLTNVDGFFYGDVWPSEVMVDIGLATLMLRWAVRLHLASHEPVCP
ncbi:MAG: hypothetical protein WBW32_10350 [Luteibacter sp.]